MVGWSVKVLNHASDNGGKRKHPSPSCWVIRSGVPLFGGAG